MRGLVVRRSPAIPLRPGRHRPPIPATYGVADELTPRLSRAFLQGLKGAGASFPRAALESAVRNHRSADDVVDWDAFRAQLERAVAPVALELVYHGARDAYRQVVQAARTRSRTAKGALILTVEVRKADVDVLAAYGLAFDVIDPNAVAAAMSETADLVRQVTDETKDGIRELLAQAFDNGMDPSEVADAIGGSVGLTSRMQRAVANYRSTLLKAGVKPGRASQLAASYADRMLQYRADMIAQTETIRASALGRREGWDQAAANGWFDPATTGKILIPSYGACEDCLALAEDYNADEDGPPPIHPWCRCSEGLDFGQPPDVPEDVQAEGVFADDPSLSEGDAADQEQAAIDDLPDAPEPPEIPLDEAEVGALKELLALGVPAADVGRYAEAFVNVGRLMGKGPVDLFADVVKWGTEAEHPIKFIEQFADQFWERLKGDVADVGYDYIRKALEAFGASWSSLFPLPAWAAPFGYDIAEAIATTLRRFRA